MLKIRYLWIVVQVTLETKKYMHKRDKLAKNKNRRQDDAIPTVTITDSVRI